MADKDAPPLLDAGRSDFERGGLALEVLVEAA
jgi:hypothetical protein